METLREMNDTPPPAGAPASPDAAEAIVMSEAGVESSAPGEVKKVESIEDQINTEMTQTFAALNTRTNSPVDADDTKKGFLNKLLRK